MDHHLQIQRRLDHAQERIEILILNMPAVFAQMADDPITAGLLGHERRPDGARNRPAPGLAKRGHMIHIDAEPDHLEVERLSDRDPGPDGQRQRNQLDPEAATQPVLQTGAHVEVTEGEATAAEDRAPTAL